MFWNIIHIPLNENKLIQKNFRNEHKKNFQHILKFHTKPNFDVKVIDCCRKEMFHPSFHFDFALINFSSNDSCIPMLNNKMQEITQHTIDAKN